MDKWKESELAKMKAGGNANMKSFLEDRSAPGGVKNHADFYFHKNVLFGPMGIKIIDLPEKQIHHTIRRVLFLG